MKPNALTLSGLLTYLEQAMAQFPDLRVGNNTQYDLRDAGLGAFAVFFTQSASFLARQNAMKLHQGRCNAESVFGLQHVPSDNQIRNLLDPVSPTLLAPVYRQVFRALERAGELTRYQAFEQQWLIALDGTGYFASQKIHCAQCNQRVLANGQTHYFHNVLTPVLVQTGLAQVLALEPEFIVPQDGHAKQDCEIQAAKRWVATHGAFYAQHGATILGDDLFSHQPFCETLLAHRLHFILTCKPDSHVQLYTTVAFLAAQKLVGSHVVRQWNGRYAELATYRFVNQVPLNGEPQALHVNWCELTLTREDTGEVLYHNAFATDFNVTAANVEAIVRDGRARWKVENENHNVLKTKGYHLEHNFGHGQQHLAAVLLSLNLLAFLFHTVLDLVDATYRAIRHKLRTRRTFFQDVETLLRYVVFANWEAVLAFMSKQLELDTG